MKSWLSGSILLLTTAGVFADSALTVRDAWVREAPPGAQMLAAYLVIENPSSQARILTGVDSRQFNHVMLHKSEVVDGIARMSHVEQLEIPAHSSLALEPGSYHLMMPAAEKRLTAGDRVEFQLHFANGESLGVPAKVRKP